MGRSTKAIFFPKFARNAEGSRRGPHQKLPVASLLTGCERLRSRPLWMGISSSVGWRHCPILKCARLFSTARTVEGRPEIAVNSSSGSHFAPSVVAFAGAGLDDVTFAIAWKGGENGIFRSRFQLFNFDGKKSGPEIAPRGPGVGEIAPATFGGNIEDPREFISVLGGINSIEGQKLTAELFVRDGTSLGVTVSGDDMVNFEPLVKALPHGGSVVTWTQKPVATTGKFGTRVMAAIVVVAGGPPDFLALSGVKAGRHHRCRRPDVCLADGGQLRRLPYRLYLGGATTRITRSRYQANRVGHSLN